MRVVSNDTGKAVRFASVKMYGNLVGQTNEDGVAIFPIADCISAPIAIFKQTFFDPLFVSTKINLEKQSRFEYRLQTGKVSII